MCLHGALFSIPFYIQHAHVLKKLNFDLLTTPARVEGVIVGMRAKY